MKFKKFLLAAVAALGLASATGFGHNLVQADTTAVQTPAPDKNEIIRDINRNAAQSGKLNVQIQFSSRKNKHSLLPFGLNNEMIFSQKNMVFKDVVKAGKFHVQYWANPKFIYAKNGKKWYKERLPKMQKKELDQQLKDGATKLALQQKIFDAMQLSDDGTNYVLTLDNNPQLNQELLQAIIKGEKLSKKELKEVKQLKIDNLTCQQTYDKTSYKLIKAEVHMTMHIGKSAVNITETTSHVNEYNDLRIPQSVIKHAKKMKH